MSSSLRDQLVKAGLATSSQAKKAERRNNAEKIAQTRTPKKKKEGDSDVRQAPSVLAKSRKLNSEKAQRDKTLAKQRNEKSAQKALRAEIRQMVVQHDKRTKVTDANAVAYNFVHGKKIKKIYVSREEQAQLSRGELVVINNDGVYHFVLPDIAKKIETRDPKRIIVAHDSKKPSNGDQAPSADDEYYAQFEVPDDLDW
ncbi:MAG: hypothetical protein ACI9ON_001110 [Limisphaerales bacterium]|jgi:uncharacterized protein YaiL (DUF2058 family)